MMLPKTENSQRRRSKLLHNNARLPLTLLKITLVLFCAQCTTLFSYYAFDRDCLLPFGVPPSQRLLYGTVYVF